MVCVCVCVYVCVCESNNYSERGQKILVLSARLALFLQICDVSLDYIWSMQLVWKQRC